MLLRKNKSLASITKKSNKILDVFTKTQKDCDTLNADIAIVVSSKEEQVKALQEEISSLNAIRTKNDNLAKKINAFLSS
jgi:hypothetical protein